MKRLIFFLVLLTNIAYSQSIIDALELTPNNIYGSARFQALGGAFTALGGDLSSTALNPAASSVFNKSEAIFSFDQTSYKSESSFYNGGGSGKSDYGNLNNMGVVFIIESAGNDYTRFALSATYDRVVNFNENIQFEGNNDTFIEVTSDGQLYFEGYSSLATSFVLASNYYTPNNLPLAEGLAFDTYLTDINVADSKYYDIRYPDYTDENPVYVSPVIANNSKQIYTSNRSGISGQYNFTASLDINNKFYIGFGYKSMMIDRSTRIEITENEFDATSDIESFKYSSNVDTYGTSSNYSIGAIYNSLNGLRLGLAYHSPNLLEMQDIYYYTISTKFKTADLDGNYGYTGQSQEGESTYTIKTPSKINAGIAYVFGKSGLLSFDYSYMDYTNIEFQPDYLFRNDNQDIKDLLKATHNFSIGGEYNISFITLRGGFKFQQSPHEDIDFQSDSKTYSLGAGLNFKAWKLDLAFSHLQNSSDLYIYEADLVDAARINRQNSNLTLSLRFEI